MGRFFSVDFFCFSLYDSMFFVRIIFHFFFAVKKGINLWKNYLKGGVGLFFLLKVQGWYSEGTTKWKFFTCSNSTAALLWHCWAKKKKVWCSEAGRALHGAGRVGGGVIFFYYILSGLCRPIGLVNIGRWHYLRKFFFSDSAISFLVFSAFFFVAIHGGDYGALCTILSARALKPVPFGERSALHEVNFCLFFPFCFLSFHFHFFFIFQISKHRHRFAGLPRLAYFIFCKNRFDYQVLFVLTIVVHLKRQNIVCIAYHW